MSNFLPNELIERLSEDPLFNVEAFLKVHEEERKTNSIRVNPRKCTNDLLEELDTERQIPWCDDGYYLRERPVYTLDPLFHAGCYYPQEASSMFLSHVLKSLPLGQDLRVLDLCAAPGGKSTLVNSFLGKDSLLVSNEIIKSRANILSDNIVKWGLPNVVVTNNDPSAFGRLPGYFDLMVVDAPCSGSGMFRKDHETISEWSDANVKLCAERQRRILADSIDALKTDGYLFYSTCSYSKEENEDILDWLGEEFGMTSVNISVPTDWGVVAGKSSNKGITCFRFYPHQLDGEGFFFAVLKKEGEQTTFQRRKMKAEKNNAPQKECAEWIDMEGLYAFLHHDNVRVFPKSLAYDLWLLQQSLYLKNVGTLVGKWTGRELVPAHDLALSTRLLSTVQRIELDKEHALNYLRKENMDAAINTDAVKGWAVVCYRGVALGWVKALANRINNYYPKELRIMNL